jgi:predicted HicB family RNase H-like nuclease
MSTCYTVDMPDPRTPIEKQVKVLVRMPERLKARLEALARSERRSLTAEIIVLLDEAADAHKPASE